MLSLAQGSGQDKIYRSYILVIVFLDEKFQEKGESKPIQSPFPCSDLEATTHFGTKFASLAPSTTW